MPKATTRSKNSPRVSLRTSLIEKIQSSLQVVSRSANQVRVHEALLRVAGVRLDRADVALLYKLQLHAETPLRVSALAALLGVDPPSVTRKVQHLEPLGYVAREPDPDDGRASLIRLTTSGQDTLERVLSAHRERLARQFEDWNDDDVEHFSLLLEKFSQALHHDTEVNYGD